MDIKRVIMGRKLLSGFGAVLPIIILAIVFISPMHNFICDPKNISSTFNISDQNRQHNQDLSIKYLGPSIDHVRLSIEGSPEGIADLNIYIYYLDYIKSNLSLIEKNITDLDNFVRGLNVTDDSTNRSINECMFKIENSDKELKSIGEKINFEINELNSTELNNVFSKNREYIGEMRKVLTDLNLSLRDLSKLNESTYELASSSQISTIIRPNYGKNITDLISNSKTTALHIETMKILILPNPSLIEKFEDSEIMFSSIKMFLLSNATAGNYASNIILHEEQNSEVLKRIPLNIKLFGNYS